VNGRGSRRFVEDLLRGKRPRRFPAEQTDIAELRTAIGLRAARPGSGSPRDEFVTDLHGQQAAPAQDTLTPTAGDWRTVAASEELPDGAVRAFDLTSLVGFVERTAGVGERGLRYVHPSGLPPATRRRRPATELSLPPHGFRRERAAVDASAARRPRSAAPDRRPRGQRRRPGVCAAAVRLTAEIPGFVV
jgi:hypothetical protein